MGNRNKQNSQQMKEMFIVPSDKKNATTLEISLAVSQKMGNSSTSKPSYSSPEHIHKSCYNIHRDTCLTIFIAVLPIIVRNWKEPKCPSTEELMKKMWYIYTRNTILLLKTKMAKFSGKWMELENIILSEVTQSQKSGHISNKIQVSCCSPQTQRAKQEIMHKWGSLNVI